MASTVRGRALTTKHRLDQVALSTRFLAASRLLLGEIDPARIDATLPDWAGLQTALTEHTWGQSKNLAVEYLTAYRIAEVGPAGAAMPIVTDLRFDAARAAVDALWLGPVAKRRIGEGMSASDALEWAFTHNVGVSQQRRVLNGGRSLIDHSALANPASHGWRRVSDGNPCNFCAILVSRGPVYRTARSAGQGRHWHNRCGCNVEEVFGTWAPDEQEQEWIDQYEAAHRPGDTIGQVAARMGSHTEQ